MPGVHGRRTQGARADSGLIVLLATLAVQSLVAMCLLTLPVVAPVVARSLGVSPVHVGLYVALAYAAAMASSLVSGGLVRRYGAIRASQAGLVLCACGLLVSLVPHVAVTALGALLIGVGYGPITPASSHLLIRSTPAHRLSFVFSIKQTGVPLGGVLAGALVPGLAEFGSWQMAFAMVAACSLACALLIQPLCRTLDADRDPAHPVSLIGNLAGPLRLVFGQRSLRALAAVSFLFSVTQLSLVTYLVTCLHEDMDIDLVTAGLLAALSQMAGVAGRILWGYASDRFLGPLRALGAIALLVALCAVLMPVSPSGPLWLLGALLLVFGFCAIGWNGVYLAEVARQAPAGKASIATGGTLSITFLGNVLGPPAFGLVAGGLHSYVLAYAVLVVPAGASLWLLWRSRQAFQPAST
ncbi:MFS transporter [Castellaniella sp.]|uniref:MFS transporter n=1 Tax=Castellaniella sp. TaxID=1955812 RepID=UPI00355E7EC4